MRTDILSLLQKNGGLKDRQKRSDGSATALPHTGIAFVYQRQSTHEQKTNHIWSQVQQDKLAIDVKDDGYPDDLIWVEKRDLGISGTKTDEQREGLAYLISLVERDQVESVWIIECSRLYRDMNYVNADGLLQLFREHSVIVVTPPEAIRPPQLP